MQEILNFFTVLVVDSEGNAHLGPRIGAVCCFSVCVAIVLFALYMIIPVFH